MAHAALQTPTATHFTVKMVLVLDNARIQAGLIAIAQ